MCGFFLRDTGPPCVLVPLGRISKAVRLLFLALAVTASLDCGGGNGQTHVRSDPLDMPDGTSGRARVERIALTTEVDPITYGPAGAPSTSFDMSERRLFLCFRMRGASPGATLMVSWWRVGDPEPMSRTAAMLEGDHWMAAEHRAVTPFRPGPHLVKVSLDGTVIREVPFDIEGELPPATEVARVGQVRLVGVLNSRGRPVKGNLRRFSDETRAVHCAILVKQAPTGTQVGVRWSKGDHQLHETDLGQVEGRRLRLWASLETVQNLPAGQYSVQILVNGAPVRTRHFRIGGPRRVRHQPPSVSALRLTRSVHPRTRQPRGEAITDFDGEVEELYLTIRYVGMTNDPPIEVRWYQDTHPDQPMVSSAFPVSGTGNLAASFSPDGPMPAGAYRVDVLRGEEVLDSYPFVVVVPRTPAP